MTEVATASANGRPVTPPPREESTTTWRNWFAENWDESRDRLEEWGASDRAATLDGITAALAAAQSEVLAAEDEGLNEATNRLQAEVEALRDGVATCVKANGGEDLNSPAVLRAEQRQIEAGISLARRTIARNAGQYHPLLLELKQIFVPAMRDAVACTDGEAILYGRGMVHLASTTDDATARKGQVRDMAFVVLHELMHAALEHPVRLMRASRRIIGVDDAIAQIAMDVVVNEIILDWAPNVTTAPASARTWKVVREVAKNLTELGGPRAKLPELFQTKELQGSWLEIHDELVKLHSAAFAQQQKLASNGGSKGNSTEQEDDAKDASDQRKSRAVEKEKADRTREEHHRQRRLAHPEEYSDDPEGRKEDENKQTNEERADDSQESECEIAKSGKKRSQTEQNSRTSTDNGTDHRDPQKQGRRTESQENRANGNTGQQTNNEKAESHSASERERNDAGDKATVGGMDGARETRERTESQTDAAETKRKGNESRSRDNGSEQRPQERQEAEGDAEGRTKGAKPDESGQNGAEGSQATTKETDSDDRAVEEANKLTDELMSHAPEGKSPPQEAGKTDEEEATQEPEAMGTQQGKSEEKGETEGSESEETHPGTGTGNGTDDYNDAANDQEDGNERESSENGSGQSAMDGHDTAGEGSTRGMGEESTPTGNEGADGTTDPRTLGRRLAQSLLEHGRDSQAALNAIGGKDVLRPPETMTEAEELDRLERAADRLDRASRMPGSEPGNALGQELQAMRVRMNWRKLLDRYLRRFLTRVPAPTPSKPSKPWITGRMQHRRAPWETGQSRMGPGGRLGICVDTSGSISDEMLAAFGAHVMKIAKSFRSPISVFAGDVVVQGEWHDVELDRQLWRKIRFRGRGGTAFHPLLERARETDCKLVVYLTDGYADFDPPLRKPTVIWALSPQSLDPKDVPWGRPIVIE